MSDLQSPFRAPVEAAVVDNKQLTFTWSQFMQIFAQQLKTPANQIAPLTSAAPGQSGQLAQDVNFLYRHNGVKWQRIAFQDF